MNRLTRLSLSAMACVLLSLAAPEAGSAATIIDEWSAVQAPPAPALKPVTLDVKTTAVLVLDLVPPTCNAVRRPRCMETLAPVHTFLDRVRGAGVPVIYTVVAGTTTADVLPAVAPKAGEPSFSSGTDKFLNTDLAKSLQDKGIKTVVTLGTGAIGAVLSTSSEAALRGLQVVVAIDGVSDSTLYAEQLTVWTLLNAPVIGPRVTMSRTDLITF